MPEPNRIFMPDFTGPIAEQLKGFLKGAPAAQALLKASAAVFARLRRQCLTLHFIQTSKLLSVHSTAKEFRTVRSAEMPQSIGAQKISSLKTQAAIPLRLK